MCGPRPCGQGRKRSGALAQWLLTHAFRNAPAANKFDNVDVLNLTDLVCPDGRCAARRNDGLFVYRDARHLTETFVLAQVAEVRLRIRRLFDDQT